MLRALALVLLPALAPAFGGTQVTWLGGTLPTETVPFLEADPKLLWGAGTGSPLYGAGLDLGLTDWWMLQGDYSALADGSSTEGRALTRVRLSPSGWDVFGAGVFGGIAGSSQVLYGLALSLEGLGSSLVFNTIGQDGRGLRHQIGIWGPYVAFALRPGLELGRDSASWIFPQLALNLPGDLSLDLGARFPMDGSGSYRVITRLSFQVFPNP